MPAIPASDIAFTPAVKGVQAKRGSRGAYARQEERGGFRTTVSADLVLFLAAIDTAYLASANAAGQPYAQHRGGPKGFIRHVGGQTLGFADYVGNKQYITTGNLAENARHSCSSWTMPSGGGSSSGAWQGSKPTSNRVRADASGLPRSARADDPVRRHRVGR